MSATHRVEYPSSDTRFLLPPENPDPDSGAVVATRFEASDAGLVIDGAALPWHLMRVPIQIEELGQGMSVVYLPVLIEGEVVVGEGVREATLGELIGEGPESPARDREDC